MRYPDKATLSIAFGRQRADTRSSAKTIKVTSGMDATNAIERLKVNRRVGLTVKEEINAKRPKRQSEFESNRKCS